jgi:hypothetical protein
VAAAIEIPARGVFASSIVIDDSGIARGRQRVAWDDVDHYCYVGAEDDQLGDFLLVTTGGANIQLRPNHDGWAMLAEPLIAALHPRLRAGGRFAPFELEAGSLGHRRRDGIARLPFAEIAEVEIVAPSGEAAVIVHRRGGGVWAEALLGDVANPFLWLERLAEHRVNLRTEIALHLPRALAVLEIRMQVAARIAPARVVRSRERS